MITHYMSRNSWRPFKKKKKKKTWSVHKGEADVTRCWGDLFNNVLAGVGMHTPGDWTRHLSSSSSCIFSRGRAPNLIPCSLVAPLYLIYERSAYLIPMCIGSVCASETFWFCLWVFTCLGSLEPMEIGGEAESVTHTHMCVHACTYPSLWVLCEHEMVVKKKRLYSSKSWEFLYGIGWLDMSCCWHQPPSTEFLPFFSN